MRPVERDELLALGAYEEIRERFRARVIDLKKARRVAVGPNMTFIFENHDTVLFQIQEMLRTERITDERAIAHELETYNELVPGALELSATLMIEVDDKDARAKLLADLVGLGNGHIRLRIGSMELPARLLLQPGEEPTRLPAVNYLRIAVPEGAARELASPNARVALEVVHEVYHHTTELGRETVQSLSADLNAS